MHHRHANSPQPAQQLNELTFNPFVMLPPALQITKEERTEEERNKQPQPVTAKRQSVRKSDGRRRRRRLGRGQCTLDDFLLWRK